MTGLNAVEVPRTEEIEQDQPVSEEEAGTGEWSHAVTAVAQAPPSSALEGDVEPQAAGGSVNNADARVVEPPVYRFEADGCTKAAQSSTEYCVAHGGGKRCQADGCTKSARGSTDYCKAHGGGKRCQADGCTKSAIGSTEY
ncbi:hypothetical protein CYMTET_51787 [Cymbomonas tetramitiformis]|uniref:WRKY19-like zinc finger domain-containing protein n=1 Tax=Cymbomonas tetramitiformis TaxID=36881 RepID=A0AAE0BKE0_9CHLO|nr:hypothetical protein CYMTET_51787 [Cymbomonas tetramitiformis]